MNSVQPDPGGHEIQLIGKVHRTHTSYWKRAHRSWQFWLAIILMLGAMVMYLMSDDLAGWTNLQEQQPINL